MGEREIDLRKTPERTLQQNPAIAERLANSSAQDFQQAIDIYAELSTPHAIKDVGLRLGLNLWRAGLDASSVIDRILQNTNHSDYHTFHSLAEFYRDTGDFRQMQRMLVAARQEPGFFDDFWLTSARKRHEFGQDPQPDLDKVRNHIETAHEFYDRYRGYSALAEATYDVTGQPQEALLALAKEGWSATLGRHYRIDTSIKTIGENEPEYWQRLLTHHLLDIAKAHGHCGDYKSTMKFHDMLDPTAVSKDDRRLMGEVLLTKTYILFNLVQACFRNGAYSEGFALAEQWFDSHKKLMRDQFETDSHTLIARITLGEALHHEGREPESKTMLSRVRRGIVADGTGISDRLFLVKRYQQALLKVGRLAEGRLYDLALGDVDAKPSDAHMEPIKNPYDLFSEEMEGQLNLRMKVDDYVEVAEGYAQIGKFAKAKEALARVEQFGDADDEIKEEKVKTLSSIACQERRYADMLAA